MSVIPITTDLAAVAVFDPEVLAHRVRDRPDWWRSAPLDELQELRDGKVAIVQTGREGAFRLIARAHQQHRHLGRAVCMQLPVELAVPD